MILRNIFVVVALLLPMTLTSCLYAHVRSPLDRDLNETRLGSKSGKASWQSYMWLVALGDAGTQAAAQNGGITVIRHADQELVSVLFGLYYKQTTIVYGD